MLNVEIVYQVYHDGIV